MKPATALSSRRCVQSVKEGKKVTTPLGNLVPLLGNLHPPFLYVMPSSLLSPLFLTLSQDL